MSVYKLSAAISSADSIAQIDIRADGILYATSIHIRAQAMDALNDYCTAEVSFGSVSSIAINDSLQAIAMHTVVQNFLTSGGGVGSASHAISGLRIHVFGGERLHLHARLVAASGVIDALLYVDDGDTDLKPPRRRR